jgi:hypothetical protein
LPHIGKIGEYQQKQSLFPAILLAYKKYIGEYIFEMGKPAYVPA